MFQLLRPALPSVRFHIPGQLRRGWFSEGKPGSLGQLQSILERARVSILEVDLSKPSQPCRAAIVGGVLERGLHGTGRGERGKNRRESSEREIGDHHPEREEHCRVRPELDSDYYTVRNRHLLLITS